MIKTPRLSNLLRSSFLQDKRKINGDKPKADPDNQAEDYTSCRDNRHVFGMIGPDGLKSTPESMADMNCRNDHGGNIYENIDRVCKCAGDNLIDGRIGFIRKMKIDQVKNDKCKQNKTGIRHGCRAQAAATGSSVDGISDRP